MSIVWPRRLQRFESFIESLTVPCYLLLRVSGWKTGGHFSWKCFSASSGIHTAAQLVSRLLATLPFDLQNRFPLHGDLEVDRIIHVLQKRINGRHLKRNKTDVVQWLSTLADGAAQS